MLVYFLEDVSHISVYFSSLLFRKESKKKKRLVWKEARRCLSLSQQSGALAAIKVSSHPQHLTLLVGIPGASEVVGSRFDLADTFPTQPGARGRHAL